MSDRRNISVNLACVKVGVAGYLRCGLLNPGLGGALISRATAKGRPGAMSLACGQSLDYLEEEPYNLIS